MPEYIRSSDIVYPHGVHNAGETVAVCIVCVVARLNVYLPDDLAAAAKRAGLNLSAVTQEAVRRSLDAGSTDAWLATLGTAPSVQVDHDSSLAALDAVRDEASTRHG
jgi:post-segregation antitoxin (ccd killing protein)